MQYADQQRLNKELTLSVIDSSGRQISLLNDNTIHSPATEYPHNKEPYSPSSSSSSDEVVQASAKPPLAKATQSSEQNTRRKYHCAEPGCNKSFTTSGHLARHNRIHTGEKNFPCLFPGCQSRFSRQDNMMQHYRTHMSPKSRRTQRKSGAQSISEDEPRPRPRLHAHHRIRSDPYQVDPPLTIDQHLSNYHRSLLSPTRSNKASPLSQVTTASSSSAISEKTNNISPINGVTTSSPSAPSSTITPNITQQHQQTNHPQQVQPPPSPFVNTTFYQHRPLKLNAPAGQAPFPFTLLHPPVVLPKSQQEKEGQRESSEKDKSAQNLMQLAHVVSTFG